MSIRKKLATLISIATVMAISPLSAQETDKTPKADLHIQNISTNASWYSTTWHYTGGALGRGIGYLGRGIGSIGSGISWTFDKAMIPIRKTGESAKKVGDYLASGPEWIEDKTGIPMQTPAGILRMPGRLIFCVTDNSSDFLKDFPKTSLGLGGSSLDLVGQGLAFDTNGLHRATQNIRDNSWGLVSTAVADAGPLAIHAIGPVSFLTLIPIPEIARDGLATTHRLTDLAYGSPDISKPIPEDLIPSGIYTYNRIVHGKEEADNTFATSNTKTNAVKTKTTFPDKKENQCLIKELKSERSRS